MRVFFILALISLTFFGSVWADQRSCTPVDFRSRLPPLRNQDSVGWCYAFAASDLVSFKVGTAISPVDIAISTEAAKESYFSYLKGFFSSGDHAGRRLTGGDRVHTAIKYGSKRGFCRDADLPSDDYVYAQMRADLKSALDEIGKMRASARAMGHASAGKCDEEYRRLRSIFPNISPAELADALDASSFRPLLDLLVDKTCKNRIKPRGGIEAEFIKLQGKRPAEKATTLNRILSSGRPVGIGYDANVVYDMNKGSEYKDNHDSSIVGRRWNSRSNSCEYLLRNSWGRSCSIPDPQYDCENGYVWLPEGPLTRVLESVYFIN